MHRIKDTTKDISGWYFAKSTDGEFSALVPVPFDDFTLFPKDTLAREIKTCVVGCQTDNGTKYTVTEFAVINTSSFRDWGNFLAGFSNNRSTVDKIDSNSRSGIRFLTFHVHSSENDALVKVVRTAGKVFLMCIEYPSRYQKTIEADSKRFFHSLKVNNGTDSLN